MAEPARVGMTLARVALWCATLFAFAVVIRSWLFGLPGLWAVAALFALATVYGLGVRFGNWGMFGDILTRAPQRDPGVVLTFELDWREAAASVDALLGVLSQHRQRATFLIDLRRQEGDGDWLPRLVREGHRVGLCVGMGRFACGLLSGGALDERLSRQRDELQRRCGGRVEVVRLAARWVGSAAYRAADRSGLLVLGYAMQVRSKSRRRPRLRGGQVVAVRPRGGWQDEQAIDGLRALCQDLERQRIPTRLVSDWLGGD